MHLLASLRVLNFKLYWRWCSLILFRLLILELKLVAIFKIQNQTILAIKPTRRLITERQL